MQKIYKKTVFDTIKKFKLVQPRDRIFIGLSGGKDSGAAAYLLANYVREKKIDCELVGFYIDFGLPIFKKVKAEIRKQIDMVGISFKIFKADDYGVDMKKIAKLRRPICSSCGVIKRYLMNKIPRELGATKVATGHHADDFIAFFLKNIIGKNFEWIAKFQPLLPTQGKNLAKIRPLFCVGGEDNRRFCEEIGLPYIAQEVCPHFFLKCKIDKNRRKWYNMVDYMAKQIRNFRRDFALGIAQFAQAIPIKEQLKECTKCDEPTSAQVCAFCRLLKQAA